MTTISRDEWLTELERLHPSVADAEGMTAQEIADALGHSRKWALDRLKIGISVGQWERAGNRRISRIDGQASFAPVYRRVKPKLPGASKLR